MTNKTELWTPENRWHFSWTQIFGGIIIGTVLGTSAALFQSAQRLATLEADVSMLKQKPLLVAGAAGVGAPVELLRPASASSTDAARPEKLLEISREQQRLRVRPSYSESASQSFTQDDLDKFIKDNVAGQVAEDLKHDNAFISVLLALKNMPPTERQALLRACEKPLHQTWAQLGRITPEGQTEAGQQAEMLIASAIVKLAKDLLTLSPDKLKELYS